MIDVTAEINGVNVSEPSRVPFELFSKKNNKTTQLINNDDESFFVKGRNDWYRFSLEIPVFVTSVVVKAAHYDHKDCEFRWKTPRSDAFQTVTESFAQGAFSFSINDLITEFEFRPDAKYFGDPPQIEVVRVEGFTLEQLENSREDLSNLNNAKERMVREAKEIIQESQEKQASIANLKNELNQQSALLRESEEKIDALKNEIETLKTKRDEIQSLISNSKAEQSELVARIEKQDATIQQRSAERDRLGKEINAKAAELKSLENDIYLFPSELGEFAKRSGKDKSFYWKLAVIPMLVITAIACQLLFNAVNLSTVFDEENNARIFSIFITRMPYVIIATAVVGAMLKIAYALVSEIIRIDKENRALAKISIVATDVSAASADGLELSDEEIYHLRTGLKMDLLREHLKNYLSDDFRYQDSERVSARLAFLKKRRSTSSDPSPEITDLDP